MKYKTPHKVNEPVVWLGTYEKGEYCLICANAGTCLRGEDFCAAKEMVKLIAPVNAGREEETCPICGYTEEDARLHGDHHLCSNKNPP